MSSRDKSQTTPHQPLLSSLVVRPSAADGGAGGDFEPGEVRRGPLSHSRSDRRSGGDSGYRQRAGSSSPVRRRDADRRYNSDFDRSGGLARSRDAVGARSAGRFRGSSPPHARERGTGRPFSRAQAGPDLGPGPFRREGINKNNPNVRPREGDWVCTDPSCGNLNFARRDQCNNCHRSRYGSGRSPPRRGYPGPLFPDAPPRHFPGPPLDRSPGRHMNGYRSPPRALVRDGPREFGVGGLPPPRHDDRFPDHLLRRDRLDFLDDHYRGRTKFDGPMPPLDWAHRDRGRDGLFNERRSFERRPLSPLPPLPPPPLPLPLPPTPPSSRGRWASDNRERSRSPVRGVPPPKDYRRDAYLDRGRDDRRGMGRDRFGGAYR